MNETEIEIYKAKNIVTGKVLIIFSICCLIESIACFLIADYMKPSSHVASYPGAQLEDLEAIKNGTYKGHVTGEHTFGRIGEPEDIAIIKGIGIGNVISFPVLLLIGLYFDIKTKKNALTVTNQKILLRNSDGKALIPLVNIEMAGKTNTGGIYIIAQGKRYELQCLHKPAEIVNTINSVKQQYVGDIS